MTDTQAQEAARLADDLMAVHRGHADEGPSSFSEAASLLRTQAARIAELERERDEADRRAGAAERNAEYQRVVASKRASWLHEAKKQWGVDPNVSFDVVWAEALSARAELARMREPLSEKQLKDVLQKTAEGIDSMNIVMTHWKIVARAIEAAHGITKTGGGV